METLHHQHHLPLLILLPSFLSPLHHRPTPRLHHHPQHLLSHPLNLATLPPIHPHNIQILPPPRNPPALPHLFLPQPRHVHHPITHRRQSSDRYLPQLHHQRHELLREIQEWGTYQPDRGRCRTGQDGSQQQNNLLPALHPLTPHQHLHPHIYVAQAQSRHPRVNPLLHRHHPLQQQKSQISLQIVSKHPGLIPIPHQLTLPRHTNCQIICH